MRYPALLLGLAALCLSFSSARAQSLSPSQLTPQEQKRYEAIKGDPAAAESFLVTRDYVRKAQAIVKGQMAAATLPDEPDQFESKYLFPGESATLKQAIRLALAAYIDSRAKA